MIIVFASFFSRIIVYFGFFILRIIITIVKRMPAKRNLNVAIAMGLRSSFSIAFTITKELPQKVINDSISIMFVKLMFCFSISNNYLISLSYNSIFC